MNNFYFFISKLLTPILIPVNFLFLSLILLLIFFFLKKKSKLILKLFIINIIIILLIGFFPLGKIGLNYLEKDYKIQNNYQNIKNIKNILVLSGSDTRIIASIKLAKLHSNSKIYYIGINPYSDKNNLFSEHDRAKKLYQSMSFSINRIIFTGQSKNTIENFNEIQMLRLKNSETILITSAYHMKRSIIIANKKGLNFFPYAIDFKTKNSNSLINNYRAFNIVDNLKKFNLFFREIFGITVFKIFF